MRTLSPLFTASGQKNRTKDLAADKLLRGWGQRGRSQHKTWCNPPVSCHTYTHKHTCQYTPALNNTCTVCVSLQHLLIDPPGPPISVAPPPPTSNSIINKAHCFKEPLGHCWYNISYLLIYWLAASQRLPSSQPPPTNRRGRRPLKWLQLYSAALLMCPHLDEAGSSRPDSSNPFSRQHPASACLGIISG